MRASDPEAEAAGQMLEAEWETRAAFIATSRERAGVR
jgi:hypothetical protein